LGKVKIDQEAMRLSSYFERVTRAHVKDCFREEETVFFVVAPGELGKAIGKGGTIIKRVQQDIGKKVRVIEHQSDPCNFVRNIIYPIRVEAIVEEEGSVVIKDDDRKKKGQIIGRSGSNLILINRIVGRFFSKEVRVV